METRVSIAACETYEKETVRRAMQTALDAVGGLDWVRPGMTVAVKLNLVSMMKPDAAATTHPTPVDVLCDMLTDRGASVVLGDSPGGLYNAAYVSRVYHATGMDKLEREGVSLNRDFSQQELTFEGAKKAHKVTVTAWLLKADGVIDFCKLKSHGMMSMSAAVKNMFGIIPGTMKPEYHYLYPNAADFADMLIDLNELIKPRLCITDAVVGMEGNGPTMGTPRRIGAVLASASCYAMDLALLTLLGLTPSDVPTVSAAIARGLSPKTKEELTVFGDLDAFVQEGFEVPSKKDIRFWNDLIGLKGTLLAKGMEAVMSAKPAVDKKKCIACRECEKICPARAIEMKNKLPVIHRKKCIRCFCCQKFCPKGAMRVKRSGIAMLLNRGSRKQEK